MCCTPFESTVTVIEYVPGGVIPGPLIGMRPVPPPEAAQLVTAPARMAISAASSQVLRRRLHASGSSTSPQASGTMRQTAGPVARLDDWASPVSTCRSVEPVVPAVTGSLAGLNTHCVYGGSGPHRKVNTPPGELFSRVIVNG